MKTNSIPQPLAKALKLLGFNGLTVKEALNWFKDEYNWTYSIGNTNIAVIHYLGTTQLLQDNPSYEAAEVAIITWFCDVAENN